MPLFKKLKHHEVLERPQVYEVLFNNAMLYIGALLLFSPSFSANEIGWISFWFFLFTGSQAALFQFPVFGTGCRKKSINHLFAFFTHCVYCQPVGWLNCYLVMAAAFCIIVYLGCHGKSRLVKAFRYFTDWRYVGETCYFR